MMNRRCWLAIVLTLLTVHRVRTTLGDSARAASPPAAVAASDVPAAEIRPFGSDPSLQDYKLRFSDDFNGDALDKNTWGYRTDSKAMSAQLPENVAVSGGLLHLAVKKEDAGKMHYTGGGIISKKEFTYGYYECRFKIPPGKGWHTSFWTMRAGGGKPAAQEIDICEQDSVDHHKYSAGVIAWGNHRAGLGRKYPHVDADLSDDFHVWGAEYTPNIVRFFFDGKMTHEADMTKVTQGPQSIWLTVIGYPSRATIDDTKLPSEATYDWVRFYEKP